MAAPTPGPAVSTPVHGRSEPLVQPKRGYRFGAENLVFGDLIAGSQAARVLDLGAGCGVLGLVAAARLIRPPDRVTLVERNPDMAAWAQINGERSAPLAVDVVQADLREATLPEADLVIANPPWFAPGAGRPSRHATTRDATHAHHGDVFDFASAAARALAPEGRFWLVGPDDGAATCVEAGARAGLVMRAFVRVYARHLGRGHRVWTAWSRDDGPCDVCALSAITSR